MARKVKVVAAAAADVAADAVADGGRRATAMRLKA
jgi:hypothetical protein